MHIADSLRVSRQIPALLKLAKLMLMELMIQKPTKPKKVTLSMTMVARSSKMSLDPNKKAITTSVTPALRSLKSCIRSSISWRVFSTLLQKRTRVCFRQSVTRMGFPLKVAVQGDSRMAGSSCIRVNSRFCESRLKFYSPTSWSVGWGFDCFALTSVVRNRHVGGDMRLPVGLGSVCWKLHLSKGYTHSGWIGIVVLCLYRRCLDNIIPSF